MTSRPPEAAFLCTLTTTSKAVPLKTVTFLTIGALGLGVVAEALDNADVPHIFHKDGFVVATSTGSAGPAITISVQNMLTGDEIVGPAPEPGYHIVSGFTDQSSGTVL